MQWYLEAAIKILETHLGPVLTKKKKQELLEHTLPKLHHTALKVDAFDDSVNQSQTLSLMTSFAFLAYLEEYCIYLNLSTLQNMPEDWELIALLSTLLVALKVESENHERIFNHHWAKFDEGFTPDEEKEYSSELTSWESQLLQAIDWKYRVTENDMWWIKLLYCDQNKLEGIKEQVQTISEMYQEKYPKIELLFEKELLSIEKKELVLDASKLYVYKDKETIYCHFYSVTKDEFISCEINNSSLDEEGAATFQRLADALAQPKAQPNSDFEPDSSMRTLIIHLSKFPEHQIEPVHKEEQDSVLAVINTPTVPTLERVLLNSLSSDLKACAEIQAIFKGFMAQELWDNRDQTVLVKNDLATLRNLLNAKNNQTEVVQHCLSGLLDIEKNAKDNQAQAKLIQDYISYLRDLNTKEDQNYLTTLCNLFKTIIDAQTKLQQNYFSTFNDDSEKYINDGQAKLLQDCSSGFRNLEKYIKDTRRFEYNKQKLMTLLGTANSENENELINNIYENYIHATVLELKPVTEQLEKEVEENADKGKRSTFFKQSKKTEISKEISKKQEEVLAQNEFQHVSQNGVNR